MLRLRDATRYAMSAIVSAAHNPPKMNNSVSVYNFVTALVCYFAVYPTSAHANTVNNLPQTKADVNIFHRFRTRFHTSDDDFITVLFGIPSSRP
jgi:hypothetical protein